MTYELETRRTLLRNITLDDAREYYNQIWSQPDVMRYLPGGAPRVREQTETYINYFSNHWVERGFGLWGVVVKETGKFIGHCGLQVIQETQEIEVAYAFGKNYWGQGLGTETAHASLRFGFEELGLERIIAIAVPENTASRRIMEKNGMKYEGLKHIVGFDLAYYVSTANEFIPNQEQYKLRKM
ncbi:MAG: GNAT family N-acetyltransferase [Chloroflexi bacterium]|nr:GNAT family N-acetyltransferase [Chloroflexota bacterium]